MRTEVTEIRDLEAAREVMKLCTGVCCWNSAQGMRGNKGEGGADHANTDRLCVLGVL